MKTLIYFIALFSLSTFLQLDTQAQTAAVPAVAQEAFNKGMIAAELPNYPLAIRYFEDARRLAPETPAIYFNLGLAESNIPGRELRAIAWFGAYLAADPLAPNAAGVKAEIDALEVKNQSNLLRLISSVEDAANQVPGDKSNYLRGVALLWAQAGDIPTAVRIADRILQLQPKESAQAGIARAQAEAGDIVGALNTAGLIGYAVPKTHAQIFIADAQIKSGDISGAQRTLAGAQKSAAFIQREDFKSLIRSALAGVQAKSGDIAGAQKTADLIRQEYYISLALVEIAKAKLKVGDVASAQNTLLDALRAARAIRQADYQLVKLADFRSDALKYIAITQARSGDFGRAQTTAELIQDSRLKNLAQKAIAEAREKPRIASAPNSHTEPSTVSDWLNKLDDSEEYSDCPLNTGPFLNLAAHLKSLPSSSDPQTVFWGLQGVAFKIATAQNAIHKMLRQTGLR